MVRTKLSPSIKKIVVGLGVLLVFISIFLVITRLLGSNKQNIVTIGTPNHQPNPSAHTFDVKRIRMVDNDGCYSITFDKNGQVTKVTCEQSLESRKILSNLEIQRLLQQLSQTEFDSLLPEYFSENLNITLIIETNYGTKEIVINDKGTIPIDNVVEDIIEDIEEIEDTLETPRPSSLPTTPPSPTIRPSGTPLPSGAPTPNPTPNPTPISGSPEPFKCADLERQGVTVSNIRCIDEGTTAY